MVRRSVLLFAVAVAALASAEAAHAAGGFDPHDFTGAWDRPHPSNGGSLADQTVPPPPLKPQYLADYQAHQKAVADANARGEPLATGYVACLPDGMPTMMMGMFPMEVLQTKGQITIIEEAYNQVRRIYLDEPQIAVDDAEPGFWGHSVGHWDGDVLSVDTVGIKLNVRFRDAPHSDQMRIDERIRVTSADQYEDQITVTDPVYLTGPWTWTWSYKRRPGYKIQEYVCEDNREYADPNGGAQRIHLLPGMK
jgi:hypothetical protein